MRTSMRRSAFCGALLLGLATPAAAQLPSAATAGLGMGDNYTAAARGYNSVRWNPANLALSGNPAATLAFFPLRAVAGLDPISLSDIADYSGKTLSADVRNAWLEQIRSEGSEQGSAGASITFAALQVGRIGFQLGTSVNALADVPPGAAQLLLFGNVDANGNPVAIEFDSAGMNLVGTSTAALSYAHPIRLSNPDQRVSIGVTLKYTIGHFMLRGTDNGSRVTAQPIAVDLRFPTITTDTATFFNNGGGVGLDAGVAWENAKWTIGASVQNVFNTFKWKEESLQFRPGVAIFTADSSKSDFDVQPFANAPQSLRDEVLNAKFKPAIALGIAGRPTSKLLVSADFRTRFSDEGIAFDPKMHVGVGAEFRPVGFLPLRAGVAKITDGVQLAGGFGLDIGSFSLAVSAARRSGDLGHDQLFMLTLISSWPGSARR